MLPTSCTSSPIEKENNGKGARTAFRRKVIISGGLCALVILLLFSIASDSNDDGTTNGMDERIKRIKQFRKGTDGMKQKFRGLKAIMNNDFTDEEKLQKILSASVHLVDLHVSEGQLMGNGGSYGNVQGVFCTLDWATHKKDPSANAMFRELVTESPDCTHNRFMMDIKTVIDAALEHDLESQDVKVLQPTGFVFHESRCGSTLVANSLAAFAPERSRVYTESTPPSSVLVACPSGQCNKGKQADLFSDVLYLMGRTTDLKEEHLFFKFQSITSLNIDVARLAFPSVPWIYVYRDPVQVMMSHLNPIEHAVCLKHKRKPKQEMQALVQRVVQKKAQNLSSEDFCAAHLASLCEYALHETKTSGTGRMVNYDTLPDILMDDIIPNYFLSEGGTFGEREKENIRRVSGTYSKGRHGKTKAWVEDSDKKDRGASDKIRHAAATFLQSSFDAFREL